MASEGKVGSSVRFDRTTVTIKAKIAEPNIYKCCDIRGKDYALKIQAAPTPEALFKQKQQYRIQSALSSQQNIVSAFGFAEDKEAGVTYTLLEYCTSTLAEKWEEMGELDTKRVVDFIQEICSALLFMHRRTPPVIHRNVAIDTIFFLRGLWKIGSFDAATDSLFAAFNEPGRVHLMRQEIEQVTRMQYRAPEMIDFAMKRVIGVKVDIWALGCLVFRLCAGRDPFRSDCTAEDIIELKYEWPIDLEVDQRIKDLVAYMLTVDPDLRPGVPMLLSKMHSLFPEWVDKRWAQKPMVAMPKRELGFTTRPYMAATPVAPKVDLKVTARNRNMKQFQSDIALEGPDSKSNRRAVDFTDNPLMGKFAAPVRHVRAMARQRPKPCTVQPSEKGGAGVITGMAPIAEQKKPNDIPSPDRDGKSRRKRRKVEGEGGESLISDIVGDPDSDEEAADCAQKNIDLMVQDSHTLIKEIRRAGDDKTLCHSLDMLFKSGERVFYGFSFKLLHATRDPLRILRNMPQAKNECVQDVWDARRNFAERYSMYEGNFKLDRFIQKCQGNAPSIGEPPICLDALLMLENYLPKVITLSHEVADRDIAGEVLIAYQATCSIAAKLLQGKIETEKINEEIVPRINVLHQAVLQSLTSYGINFPKTPYDFSKPETIIGN